MSSVKTTPEGLHASRKRKPIAGYATRPLERVMEMWVVYERPTDMPEKFVGRKWYLEQPTADIVVADTLLEVRKLLPKGMYRIEKNAADEPHIVEMWV